LNYKERFDEIERKIPHQFRFVSNYKRPDIVVCGSYKVKEYDIERYLNFQDFPTIISLEGIRGAGKSTQALLLKKELEKYGKKTLVVRPVFTNSMYGKTLKRISKDMYVSFNPKSDSLLLMADFVNTIHQIRNTDLDIVIFDRYFGSFETVQSVRFREECGWSDEKIKSYMLACRSFLPKESISFLLSLPVKTAIERLKKRKLNLTQREIKMTYEVNKKYLDIKKKYICIDTTKRIEDTKKEILEHIRDKIL
jgi:thymidylate kinase